MAYSEFTLESLTERLSVTIRPADLFPDLPPVAPPTWLQETLAKGDQGTHLSLISEKSRSEFIVVPILLACRELSQGAFVIYSGHRLDVDASKGLVGECDFILAATEPVLPLRAPIATIVEAKKNDVEGGLGQCIAQMVGARLFNQASGKAGGCVYGCVTTGETWQFLRLEGDVVWMDRRRYYLDNLGGILAVVLAIVAECRDK